MNISMAQKKDVVDDILDGIEPGVEEDSPEEEGTALAVEGKAPVEREYFSPREFDGSFIQVYMSDPFLGQISMEVTKVIDPNVPTAYVGLRRDSRQNYEVIMGISPKFFRSLTEAQRVGVIRHELYHIIFQHIFSRASSDPNDQRLQNWATDMAINSIIGKENLPELCLLPGHRPMDPKTGKPITGPYAEFIEKAKPNEASDYYFEELKRIRDEEREKNGGGSNSIDISNSPLDSMDDHNGWGNLPEEIAEQLRGKLKDMVERAAKNAERNNNWGSTPAYIQELIRKMISKEIDWRSILKNFIGRSRSQERISTVRKINKKLPYIYPGVKRPLHANFVCFIDQSGSMSDQDIALMFGELQSLSSLIEIDTYHFDTQIDEDSHRKWRKNDPFPPLRTRCGGTDFQAVADFCNRPNNRGRWSGVIILTDGYAPVMGQIVGSKVLWVVTETGTMEHVRMGDLAIQMKKSDGKFKPF
jgi:predicted metal-dependent peptidase